jgi:hypothetical protein
LLGPTLIALTIRINLHIWATSIAAIVYLNGALHWLEAYRWSVSDVLSKLRKQERLILAAKLVLFATGVFLAYKAYGPKEITTAE